MLPVTLPANPPPRSPDALKVASYHVAYEVHMIRETAMWLDNHRVGSMLDNTILEAFLVHVRNMIYFLWNDTRNHFEDVLAIDFFEDRAAWKVQRPAKPALLDEVNRKTNVYVTHLSYERRVEPDHRQWLYGRIFQDIAQPIQAFIDLLPPDRLHPDLHQFRKQ